MNSPIRAVLAAAMICTLPATANAAGDAEWFAAIKTSFGDVIMQDTSHHGTIGTGQPFNGDVDGRITDDDIDDYSGGVGFAFGRRVGYWTLEGEYIWRYRTDWDLEASTYSIGTITNVFSNVQTETLLINLLRRGPINQHWSWEVGAGLGLVRHDVESEYLERPIPGVRPQRRFEDSSSRTDFSYNLLAGVTRELGGAWTLNMRYRFIDLGELRAGPFPERPARVSADAHAHEVQFSLEREI